MKRMLFALAALLLALASCTAAAAGGRTLLRVGYIPGTGFLEEDRPGHLRGYGYEYMQFLAQYGNWDFEYIPSSTWQECNEKLQSGAIDILPGMPGNYLSLKNVKRTDHVVGRLPMELVVGEAGAKPNMRIGTIPANPPLVSLPKVAAQEGFTYELVSYPLFYDMEEAFRRGELDGYVGPMLEPNRNKNVLSIFDRQSYRLLVRPDRKELLDALNAAMDQMLLDQPSIRDRLNEKYLRTGGFPLVLTRQEREYLAEKKKLSATILVKERPYAYVEDGAIKGVLPGVVQQISEDLGIEIEILDADSPADAAHLIQTGRADFVVDAVCDFSWADGLNMAPTQSYLSLEYVPVKRKGTIPDGSAVVACDADLLYTQTFVMPIYPEERRLYVQSLQECFRAVSDGRADILFAPRSQVPYLIEETGTYNLEYESESAFVDTLSLGVYRDADSRLWQILNKEVNHLDLRSIRSAVNDAMDTSNHMSIQWLIYHYPMRALGVMSALAVLAAGIAWYRTRLRRKHMDAVQQIAYTDQRYGLPNLSWLEEELPKLRQSLRDEPGDLQLYIALFAMDSQSFAPLPYGKELFDKQVKDMAEQLRREEWILATAAGDETGHILCACKGANDAEITRLVRTATRTHGFMELPTARVWQGMHAGICPLGPEDPLRRAEDWAYAACRRAQARGEDASFFDDAMKEELELSHRMARHMEAALASGESQFHVLYRPICELATGKAVGAETVVQWHSPDLGILSQDRFRPLFEANGFAIPLDYFVLETVLRMQQQRLVHGKDPLPVFVPQSGLHIAEENYLEKMKRLAEIYRPLPGLLALEFGDAVFGNPGQEERQKRTTHILDALHQMGFAIALSDFGTGSATFRSLRELPLQAIGIRLPLQDLAKKTDRVKDLLENFLQLGRQLEMDIIGKDVETEFQAQRLAELGCRLGIGSACSAPVDGKEFEKLMDKAEAARS